MGKANLLKLILTCCSINLCTCCTNFEIENRSSIKLSQPSLLSPKLVASSTEPEPKFQGVPLSCRIAQINSIKDRLEKPYEVLNISKTYAEAHYYEKALLVIEKIDDDFNDIKNSALATVALEYIKVRQYKEAFSISNQLDSYNKSRVLAQLATSYGEIGAHKKALLLARLIEEDHIKVLALVNIAMNYGKAGKNQIANTLFSQALEIASNIPDTSNPSLAQKDQAFTVISKAYAVTGQYDQALKAVEEIKSDIYKADVLAKIGLEYYKVGRKDQAENYLSQAFNTAKNIDTNYRSRGPVLALLSAIANDFALIGLSDHAFHIVDMLKDDWRKVDTLVNFSKSYQEIGKKAEMNAALLIATRAAKSIQDESSQASSLIKVATGYQEIGQKNKVELLLDQASEIAKSIKEVSDQTRMLSIISLKYLEAGHPTKALQVARTIEDTTDRDRMINLIECATEHN
ncbi:tetratricopeptide repeat protein [Pantanalinema sp. GBBB05]|uniref:tetratricopeptide repeat protein n=1 Tax=Pantanalinema sp. GBBB05 TaxID=2604139 RepID=UPI003D8129CE